MATQHGFGSSVSSGLTFAYDTIDTVNSYLGEPTTNLINPNTVNIYSWWGRTVQTITQLSETYNGQPIYRVSLSIDDGDMLYHIRERWGAGSGWYMPYVIFNASTPYIASVIYRPVSHADTRVYGHPSNIGGWGRNVDDSIDLDGGWKKHRIDRNHNVTVGDNRFYHMHTPSAEIGQTVTVDITHSQIEQKDHVTQFTSTSRSATQGLLPLAGNSTLNIANVSFDSNAQMTFDGSDDHILTSENIALNGSQTFEVITTISGGPQSPAGIISNHDYANTSNFGLNHISGNRIGISIGYTDNSREYDSKYTTYTATVGTPFHLVMTFDQSSNTVKLYINGVLDSTFVLTKTVKFTSRPVVLGRWDYQYTYYYFNGKIPVAKAYNRALSAADVTQNFKKYQTRFGLA
jgi:hypothetical protein